MSGLVERAKYEKYFKKKMGLSDMKLKGKVAIITGATGGVGKVTAKRLLSEGCKVVLIGRDRTKLTEINNSLGNKRDVLAVRTDITKEAEVLSAIDQTISKFDTVDILVNSAGVISDPNPFHLMNDDQWNLLINVNLIGTFRFIKSVLPIMMEKNAGNIVNISSLLGIRSIANVPLSVYGVTKAGVIMLTKSIAVEYGQFGIRCNCIAPSTIKSPVIEPYLQDDNARHMLESSFPLRSIGEPEDISGAVSYLCSEDAKWITGTVIMVDGGISAKQ